MSLGVITCSLIFADAMGQAGGSRQARPSSGSQRPSGGSQQRPSSGSQQRPSSSQQRPSSSSQQRPSSSQRPANTQNNASRPAATNQSSRNTQTGNRANAGDNRGNADRNRSGNNTNVGSNNRGGNNTNVGNRNGNNTNVGNRGNNNTINRGGNNVNVNVNRNVAVVNNRNTVVRRNTFMVMRPPMVCCGFRVVAFRPFFFHPFVPFVWGPMWHPWGFFVATMAMTAIIVSFADADLPPVMNSSEYFVNVSGNALQLNPNMRSGPNMAYEDEAPQRNPIMADDEVYYYDEGVFYLKEEEGYTVVAGPIGALVKKLPDGFETVNLDEAGTVKNYYYGGTFYEKVSKGYKVVPPTSGAAVEKISQGAEEVTIGEIKYVKLGSTYYMPVQVNGKNMYEVVEVEEDK